MTNLTSKAGRFLLPLATVSLMSGIGCSAAQKTAKPNVLVILTDDQGYGDFACTGNPWLKTPNVDNLYAESTRLTDFHVSPCCAPTRASLLTGHYTNRTGCWHTVGGRSLLYEDETTMADVFQDAGYRTGMFGKWHLGDNYPYRPQDRGFDEVFWHKAGGVGQLPDYWNNDYFNDTYFRKDKPEKTEGYCTDVWFNEAMAFMKNQIDAKKPFFTYLATNAPHGPFYVADKYSDLYKNVEGVVSPYYYGMVANLDENMGRLLQFLEKEGVSENTIVVFLTDNGAVSGGSFVLQKGGFISKGYNAGMRGGKISEYEGGHRVPCFIRWPKGGIAKGKDVADLTAQIDLFPTLLELVGIQKPDSVEFDGTSLKDRLTGKESKEIIRSLVVDNQRVETPVKYKNYAVMRQKWRLVDGTELYDLTVDQEQRNNVADLHPDIVRELAADYEAWWSDIEPATQKIPAIGVCTKDEPVTLISAMDMHPDVDGSQVPWKQEHVRSGLKNTGWYAVNVATSGSYKVRMYRYPQESGLSVGDAAPATAKEPGTNVKPYETGVVMAVSSVRFTFGEQIVEAAVGNGDLTGDVEVYLKAGEQSIRAEFVDTGGNPFSAYYFTIERN